MTAPLVYAIGDIHGRLDLFEAAVRAIDARGAAAGRTVVVLGDFVDRGPGSAQMVERLKALEGAGWVCLKGNHEAMMVEALRGGDRRAWELWFSNGGAETLDSYGGADAVPAADLDWLETLPLWWRDAHRDYVHAGLEPGVPLEAQEPASLLWIRDRFLAAPAAAFSRHVVHGHTPRWRGKPDPSEPERLAHRTNLDTGAWMTGVLSIGVFDPVRPGGPLEVLAVRGEPG
jgi:serine/threonine protein phosphatase 1